MEEKNGSFRVIAQLSAPPRAGSQEDFRGRNSRFTDFGCGLIALADLLLYLPGAEQRKKDGAAGEKAAPGTAVCGDAAGDAAAAAPAPDGRAPVRLGKRHRGGTYEAFLCRLDLRLARVRRRLGLNGFSMAAAFNARARKRGWSLRARWGVPKDRILPETEAMLGRDIPVIFAVGPGFRTRGGEKGAGLYEPEEEYGPAGTLTAVRPGKLFCRISAHYMTIFGVIETEGRIFLRLMSWGREYLLDWEELKNGSTGVLPFFGTIFTNILELRER